MNSSDWRVCKRVVIATVRVPGYHRWPDAPDEVHFLAALHRHLFTLRVEFDVSHDERQVEFFIAQKWIRAALTVGWGDQVHGHNFGEQSCETIATKLRDLLLCKGFIVSSVEVWEDDENGARVEWCPPHVPPSPPLELQRFGGSL